jgi:hypothetical protein
MKSETFLVGGVLMGFFIILNANGQAPPTRPVGVTGRQAARELIEATLRDSVEVEKPGLQSTHLQKTIDKVIALWPNNLEVTNAMTQAISHATDGKDDHHATELLIDALREAKATLAFKPFIEAPLPEGFPEPTPVGEILIKQYPQYRLARTQMAGAESSAFWTLFTHIKKKDIAMTAPVEMPYGVGDKDKLQAKAMAFLYRSPKQGKAGTDEKVEVIDVAPIMALSMGMRGEVNKTRLAEAKAHLEAWLNEHAREYEASGPLRVMGYNSPFVAAKQRFTEVEIPVRRK